MIFKDRIEAGQQLATKLLKYKNNQDAIILGLPRGGVPVAYEISKFLNISLDIVVPRKISAPSNPEFAIGAITPDGEQIFDYMSVKNYMIDESYIKNEIEKEKKEAERRQNLYRENRPKLNLKNKIAIIVDDGIATGLTIQAAILSVKKAGAKKIIVAVPVTAKDSLKKIKQQVDQVIYLHAPNIFMSVGNFYRKFDQTSDEEVIELMKN